MFDFLKRDITYLHGVGPKRAEILKKEIGVSSFGDMLFYFPYKYVDRSRIYTVSEINGEMPYVQLRGRILSFEPAGAEAPPLKAAISPLQGILQKVLASLEPSSLKLQVFYHLYSFQIFFNLF